MATLRIVVSGRVQGVYFRASAKEEAMKLGINGWVRNTKEGNVELEAEGGEEALNAFVDWCRKGPSSAEVAHISITKVPGEHHNSFEIRR
jgi:acylphosphatase